MKTMNKLVIALVGLGLAGAGYSQTTVNPTMRSRSFADNPGVLGNSYADLNYSWIDFHRDGGVDADGFNAGFKGNAPVAPGIDVALGYNYYRENNHRNPFTGSTFDPRYHQLVTTGTFFVPSSSGMKPFVSGSLGYQWSHGDFQRLRAYDSQWLWGASGGVELGMGFATLTPRVSYTDSFESNGRSAWHYGGEVHHWFTERVGGYLDATFHDPRRNGGAESWTYTAGVRMKF